MIGIDITDLHDSLFHNRNVRSLNLILHKNDGLIEHENIFWLLWTAKEAVFKQRRKDDTFNPKSAPIQLIEKGESITFESQCGNGFFEITVNYILAIAYSIEHVPCYKVIQITSNNPNKEVRQELIQDLSPGQNLSTDDLGLPIIHPNLHPVSFSHHGRFAAYAF